MAKRQRERIGPFVITGAENLDSNFIVCAKCEKKLARVEPEGAVPSCEQLLDAGAVAWSNFGWFCSVICESAYAQEFGVWLERTAKVEPIVPGGSPPAPIPDAPPDRS